MTHNIKRDLNGLFDLLPKDWEEGWRGMPDYEHRDLQPTYSIQVHFDKRSDLDAFARLVGQTVTERTRSIWYPKLEQTPFRAKAYAASRPTNPRYPVYVISKGRWESRLTSKALEHLGVPYKIVVEPQERDAYAAVIDVDKILVLPFSNLGQGSIPARNWVWEHALESGAKRHWILDDNIRKFALYQDNMKSAVDDGAIFAAAEDYTDRYTNVYLSGFQYWMFVSRKVGGIPPIYVNSRIYSCILIKNDIPYRWRGRYNEDTDLSLRVLKDGHCTILFNAFLADKMATMQMKGGNTDELYAGDGRLKMAQSLVDQHPDIVSVTWKWGRHQHHVDYRGLRANRLIRDPDVAIPEEDPYGVRNVVDDDYVVRSEPAPIVFAPKSMTLVATRAGAVERALHAPAPSVAPAQLVHAGARVSKLAPQVAAVTFTPRAVEVPKDPFLEANARELRAAGRGRMLFDAAEWDHHTNTAVGVDVEVYPNFFLACFKRFSDGHRVAHEMSQRAQVQLGALRALLESNVTVSFNGFNYDLPILRAALEGADCARLFELSQGIIKRGEKPARRDTRWNHVDLFEVNPSVRMGLKMLHGRLHGRWLVDLPYPPEEPLTPEQMNVVTLYCMNDLDATETLRTALLGPLELRAELGKAHGLDLRSKSDAQVGEAIVRKRLGVGGRAPDPTDGTFRYTPPEFLQFRDARLCEVLDGISRATFTHDLKGAVTPPDLMKDLQVTLGETTYSMGIGGLHSTEAHRALLADDDHFLLDVDAASQYPLIIMGLGLHPTGAGPDFARVYGDIVRERLAAKAAGDRLKADGLKIAVNGVFGKLGSPYSFLYAPAMLLATTLTGQLSLLMLAEAAEGIGARVVSANTDGLVLRCPRSRAAALDESLATWESIVGMQLERTRYSALYSSSVNTYVAVKEDGSVKRKGWIANPWAEGDLRGMMQKNPQMTVVGDAAVAHLTKGTPLDETIDACHDPRAFVTLVRATGGASWRGGRLGRVVRYYWSTAGEQIVYTDSGRRVAKTEGAKPMMELTDRVPIDLDRKRYVAEAEALLVDLGVRTQGVLL